MPDLRVGSALGPYTITAPLPRGGTSVVYLATDGRSDRQVAVKVLEEDLIWDPGFTERFIRESRMAAALEHPNIVPIYEAGELDGLLYVAMRYVPGGHVGRVLDPEHPLPLDRTLSVLGQVARALGAAHTQGLIHRAVKPTNILIDHRHGSEHAYLSDFGIAKRVASSFSLVRTARSARAFDHLAPEQIEGREPDGRTDVYALACVLYQCLVGTVPFDDEDPASVLDAHCHRPPPRCTHHRPDLPAGLDAVIARGMAKDPQQRYESPERLVQAAAAAIGPDGRARSHDRASYPPTPDRGALLPASLRQPAPSRMTNRSRTPTRRTPAAAAGRTRPTFATAVGSIRETQPRRPRLLRYGSVIAVLTLLFSVIGFFIADGRIGDPRSGLVEVWSFAAEGAVSSSVAVASGVAYLGTDAASVYALNASTGVKLWSHPSRGVHSSMAVANGVVYVGAADGKVYALDASTGVALWSHQTSGIYSSPAVANGMVYVGAADGNVYALKASTGIESWHAAIGTGVYSSPAVADGLIYVGSDGGTVYALNASTGTTRWTFTRGDMVFSSPAVANRVMYMGSANGSVYAVDASTGADLWSTATESGIYASPAVANGVIYVASADGSVYALNASTGARLWSFATGSAVYSSPTVANGVIYVGSDGGRVYALNASTGVQLGTYRTGGIMRGALAAAKGLVYVGSQDAIYALKAR